uniref:Cilia- and flagella-associated protein 43 n=1 Tax=Mola mola TaxID=94237 RepID=A0A3Q3WB09_MOLML
MGVIPCRWIQGFTDKSFFAFVNNETVCYTAGSHICFLNVETKIQHVFESSVRGIGALTANGKSGIFAFSDHKLSPSIFVYNFKDFHLKNELKGSAQLDYTSLALSDDGPYLACCSSLPDHIITVWNWEKGERLCAEPEAGRDVISLVFNPLNCFQLCALGTTSLTLWNIEKSTNLHYLLRCRAIELPTTDGSFVEGLGSISGIKGGMVETRLTPGAICWTQTSELYVGCTQGFLLLVNPESLSVSVLFNPTCKQTLTQTIGCGRLLKTLMKILYNVLFYLCSAADAIPNFQWSQISITQTWQTEGPVSDVMHFPDSETLLLRSDRVRASIY